MSQAPQRLVRPPFLRRFEGAERHATWLELFFDLCFVAAIAALASELHSDPTAAGVGRFVGLFIPVWWAWMGFTWYASAFDNDDTPTRLAFLAAMLGVIALAANVGSAWNGATEGFALAYGVMFLLLSALFLRARHHAGAARAFAARYALGYGLGGALWILSASLPAPQRYWLWVLAQLILMTTPVLAVVAYDRPAYDEAHIPERYGLFTIIVLGESIVVIAVGFGDAGAGASAVGVAAAGFVIAASIWWVYFDFVRSQALSRDRLSASFVWGYGHLLVFAGIAAASVGVELAVEAAAHEEALDEFVRVAIGGGLAAYLLAIAAIQAISLRRWDVILTARTTAIVVVVVTCVTQTSPPITVVVLAVTMAMEACFEVAQARLLKTEDHRGP
jgi:low temperature requirement protein LtrA